MLSQKDKMEERVVCLGGEKAGALHPEDRDSQKGGVEGREGPPGWAAGAPGGQPGNPRENEEEESGNGCRFWAE